ncbi:hypothetical protein G6O67_001112 [Ophiocordyceps sinensis]|uniref:Uncharacterized protein n=1 Tax=Ophiocordyceps sinensis TaxID=72228 RepID=A0A8H4PWV6_9HYPO|nr:hypothetical protein G6O67_001112 [Ophiocordyceps sinensis]
MSLAHGWMDFAWMDTPIYASLSRPQPTASEWMRHTTASHCRATNTQPVLLARLQRPDAHDHTPKPPRPSAIQDPRFGPSLWVLSMRRYRV